MDAFKQAHRALCVYGELKRTKAAGGEKTRDFIAQITAALSVLTTDEQNVVQCIYIMQMTVEEAAEAVECDVSTISRRKRRALDRLALQLYTDQYLHDNGL